MIIGTQSTGQGHETTFPELISGVFGVAPECVVLRTGDTAFVTAGGGTHSGRSLRLESLVMHAASGDIIEKGRAVIAALAGAGLDDVNFDGGRFVWRAPIWRSISSRSRRRCSTTTRCRRTCAAC